MGDFSGGGSGQGVGLSLASEREPERFIGKVPMKAKRHMVIQYGGTVLNGGILSVPDLNLGSMIYRVINHGKQIA